VVSGFEYGQVVSYLRSRFGLRVCPTWDEDFENALRRSTFCSYTMVAPTTTVFETVEYVALWSAAVCATVVRLVFR